MDERKSPDRYRRDATLRQMWDRGSISAAAANEVYATITDLRKKLVKLEAAYTKQVAELNDQDAKLAAQQATITDIRAKLAKAGDLYMDIRSPSGTNVVFAHPKAGEDRDRDRAKVVGLEVGATYTVNRTVVHPWRTDVYLHEHPVVCFNSVQFGPDNAAVRQIARLNTKLDAQQAIIDSLIQAGIGLKEFMPCSSPGRVNAINTWNEAARDAADKEQG